MDRRLIALSATLALIGCNGGTSPQSLVGEGAAPEVFALAGDTITVWRHVPQPNGTSRFQAFSVTPGGLVGYLDELERANAPDNPEAAGDPVAERRRTFTLSATEFSALRADAALLRPLSLGPKDPVGGFGGEAYPKHCPATAGGERIAGIKFINAANWGDFVLQADCAGGPGKDAAAVMTRLFDRLAGSAASAPAAD